VRLVQRLLRVTGARWTWTPGARGCRRLDVAPNLESEMVMQRFGFSRQALLLVGAAVAAVLCGAVALGEGGRVSQAAADGVPANLTPPPGEARQVVLLGIGAQVYACQASATAPTGYAWTFVAPAAVLLDETGAIAGTTSPGRPGGPRTAAASGAR
jgi:hypothetical protein